MGFKSSLFIPEVRCGGQRAGSSSANDSKPDPHRKFLVLIVAQQALSIAVEGLKIQITAGTGQKWLPNRIGEIELDSVPVLHAIAPQNRPQPAVLLAVAQNQVAIPPVVFYVGVLLTLVEIGVEFGPDEKVPFSYGYFPGRENEKRIDAAGFLSPLAVRFVLIAGTQEVWERSAAVFLEFPEVLPTMQN